MIARSFYAYTQAGWVLPLPTLYVSEFCIEIVWLKWTVGYQFD